MLIPPYLHKGDKIAIVAPARKISSEELNPALEYIRNLGFEPVAGKNIFEMHHQFAGTDELRIADLQWALDNPDIKAIIAARGGYGCLRIIDKLDFTKFRNNPKWVIGYSDLTVFHSHFSKVTNVATIHATMPINFKKNDNATQTLFNALMGAGNIYRFSSDYGINMRSVTGVVTGGNLSLLYALQGSVSDVDTNDKILFIEDLDEYLYHIDRMMLSLKRSGKLKNLKALLVGSFTEMKDNAVPYGKNASQIIADAVKEYNYPVFFNFPAGHQDDNRAIEFGKQCTISLESTDLVFRQ